MSEEIHEITLDIPEEIPLDIPDIPNIPEEVSEQAAPAAPENIKPKAKGRPKGSQNKGPSKPRAKKQIKEATVEEESPPACEPSSPRRNLKLPMDPTSSDIAAEMLRLLQDQTYSRQARKQRLYSSWFQ